MKHKIRWAILGCGRIARKFAADLRFVPNAELIAVASRDPARANAFADEFRAAHRHNHYEALAQHPEVDAVYVATPHGLHFEHTLLCLRHKKAALCEKPLAMNQRQAREMIALAKSESTFLMEGLWTAFLPHYQTAKRLIGQGKVGTIKYVHAEFGFIPASPVPQRMYDPQLGGGSLLDIGLYPVFLALDLLGAPDSIQAAMAHTSTGVDESCSIQFGYRNGATAQLFSTFAANLAGDADIAGSGGRLRLTSRFHGPTTSLEFCPMGVDTREAIPFEAAQGNGFEYEARHVTDCLLQGLTESPVRTHAHSLSLMATLDQVRQKAGLRYAVD